MVNDTAAPVEVSFASQIVSLSGEGREFRMAAATCGPDRAETLLAIDAADLPEDRLLFWSFAASNGMRGEGHHAPVPYKALELEPSGLAVTSAPRPDGGFDITVSARSLALHVMVEASVAGRWSDNAIDLLANEERRLVFTPSQPPADGETPSFHALDLQSCQSGSAG